MQSKNLARAVVLTGVVALVGYCLADDHNCSAKGSSAKLQVFKQLAGEWLKVGEDGRPTDEVISNYRITSGGSAVIETIFPGTDHEMVTVYFEENDELTLTHYCVLGNQPRMRVEFGDDPNRLTYKCTGGTNIQSETDEHMHEARLTILGKDHIRIEWLKFKNGKHDYTAAFELVRRGGQGM